MSYEELQEGVERIIEGMRLIARNGKYQERHELYRTIYAFDWFKNQEGTGPYGDEVCFALTELENFLEDKLTDEDILEINPDYESEDYQ